MSEIKPATAVQIREFFGLDTRSFMEQWKALNDEEKTYFKTAIGEQIANGGFVPSSH